MSALSDYLENKILDHAFGVAEYVAPSTLSIALFSSDPGESGTSGELSGGGYARVTLPNHYRNFGLRLTGAAAVMTDDEKDEVTNKVPVTFPSATSLWEPVKYWAIYDDAGTPNMLVRGTFDGTITTIAGDVITIPALSLTIALRSFEGEGGFTQEFRRRIMNRIFGRYRQGWDFSAEDIKIYFRDEFDTSAIATLAFYPASNGTISNEAGIYVDGGGEAGVTVYTQELWVFSNSRWFFKGLSYGFSAAPFTGSLPVAANLFQFSLE